MNVYYAHCKAIYGTPQEERDMNLLAELFGEENILNPSVHTTEEEWKEHGMDFIDVLHQRHRFGVVAFRALPDGRIPCGVAYELAYFVQLGVPVIELPAGYLPSRSMTLDETRAYLAEVGER